MRLPRQQPARSRVLCRHNNNNNNNNFTTTENEMGRAYLVLFSLGFKLTPGEEEEETKKDKMGDPLAQHTAVGAISSVFRMVANGNMYPARSLWLLSPLFFLTDRFGTLSGVLHDFLSVCVCLLFSFKTVKKSLHGERELCVFMFMALYILRPR